MSSYKFLPVFHNYCNSEERYLFLLFIIFTSIIWIFTALSYSHSTKLLYFKSIHSTPLHIAKARQKPKLGAITVMELLVTNRLKNYTETIKNQIKNFAIL